MAGIKVRQFLNIKSAHQTPGVRLMAKRPPSWRDPDDISWAQPLFDKMNDGVKKASDDPPAKLHLVKLARSTTGRPWWEKKSLTALGLGHKRPSTVIQKNTPTINKMLMSVKHLVKVIPIKLPHGLPSDESDFHHCVLHDDGTLEIKRVLHPVEKSLTDSSQEREGGIWAMQDSTVERACMRVLQTFSLSREYFPAKYIYKYNQDGKEHRYTGDHNIGANRDWY